MILVYKSEIFIEIYENIKIGVDKLVYVKIFTKYKTQSSGRESDLVWTVFTKCLTYIAVT